MKRWRCAVLGLGLATIFAQRRGLLGDGEQRFNDLTALLTRGELGAGKYSMVGPLFATPLFYLGKAIHNPAWGCISFNFLIFCLGLWALTRGLRGWLDDDERFTFAMLLAMGSMFPNHLQNFYGEVFTALAVGVGLLWVTRGRPLGGWALAIVGAINTPASVLGLGLASTEAAARVRRWRWLAVPLIAALGILLENAIRRGSLFHTGYDSPLEHGSPTAMPFSGRPGFSYPFVPGVLSILISFGKGLVFYCPGLFVRGAADRPKGLVEMERRWWLFLLGLIVIYAKWWAWYGGWFWGPRFFLFASLIASLRLALAYRRAETPRALLVCLLLIGWSFWVGVNGIVFGTGDLELCTANNNALEALCWYTPEFSPLFRPFLIARPLHGDRYLTLALFFLAYLAVTVQGWRRLGRLCGESTKRWRNTLQSH